MLRKLRLRQKNGFLIKKTCKEKTHRDLWDILVYVQHASLIHQYISSPQTDVSFSLG